MSKRQMYGTSALLALAVLTFMGATALADSSLVGWWPLDEGTGTVAKDASGNGHDGTFQGEPNWVAGHFGSAVYFDGVNDYVDTGFTQNLGVWTVGCWVKSPAAPAALAPAGPVHREANFQINWNHTDVNFRAAVGGKVGTAWAAAKFGDLQANTWYYLAGTFDGQAIKAYTNGQLAGTKAVAGTAGAETNTLKFGKHAVSSNKGYFNGTVDDVKVFNRPLSQQEILCAMNNYSVDPVGWWKFDETSGAVAADSAGDRDGTLLPPDPNAKGLGPQWVAGKIGGGLRFAGTASGNYVDLPIGDLMSTLQSATFAVWVNWAGSGGDWQRVLDFGSGMATYAFLAANRGGTASPRFAMKNDLIGIGEQIVTASATLGTGWHHMAVSIDSATMRLMLCIDGVSVATATTLMLPKDMGVTTQNWVARSQYPADAYYKGDVDDLRIYDRALTDGEVLSMMQGGPDYGVANAPNPANKSTGALPDGILSWKAGQLAQTHDVYFGADFNSVANATLANPLGVTVSPGQTATTFPVSELTFLKTYYWRVDEVGPAPAFAVIKGSVWSFTVEALSTNLTKSNITPTASSSAKDQGPEKTIDGSGLTNDKHGTKATDMWLSDKAGPQPAWIQYQFNKIYSLNTMLVWNSNQDMEADMGYGAKDVTVEYSVDGVAWTKLGDFEFVQAPGDANCAADTKVDFGGAPAKFVKLTINSNWGDIFPQFGLSEVRFSSIPAQASSPSPAANTMGSVDLVGSAALSWRPGRGVVSHEVYLGTDLSNMALVATVAQPSYTAALEANKTYYWQVVEVNEAAKFPRWPSDIWSFRSKGAPVDPGVANLAALYAMEGNFDDSAGAGLNGVVPTDANFVPSFIDSMAGFGKAASFNGVSGTVGNYATLPIGTLLSSLSDITVVTWVNFSGTGPAWQRVWDFGTGNGNYMFLTPAQSGGSGMRFAIKKSGVSERSITAAKKLATGWHQVAVTLDSSATAVLYLDGTVVAIGAVTYLPKDLGVTNQNWLGKSQYPGDGYYKGAIDDLRIYNRVLSEGEIMYVGGQR